MLFIHIWTLLVLMYIFQVLTKLRRDGDVTERCKVAAGGGSSSPIFGPVDEQLGGREGSSQDWIR